MSVSTGRPSRPPSRSPVLIAGLGIGLAGLAMLNMYANRINPIMAKEAEEEAQAKASSSSAAASQKPPTQQPRPSMRPGASGMGGELVALGEEAVLGAKNGKREVVIGWEWTPEVQADPSKVYAAIEAVKKAAPDARIRVVNRDASPDTPAGVVVNGKSVVPLGADGSISESQAAAAVGTGGKSAAPVLPGAK